MSQTLILELSDKVYSSVAVTLLYPATLLCTDFC